MSIRFDSNTRSFCLHGKTFSYVLHIDENGHLLQLHWGAPVGDADMRYLLACIREGASHDPQSGRYPFETPTDTGCYYYSRAVGGTNAAGDTVIDLRYDHHSIVSGKPALAGLPAVYTESDAEADTLTIVLRDPLTGLTVEEIYTVMNDADVLTRSKRVINNGTEPFRLEEIMSGTADLWGDDYQAVHLKGAWSRERQIVRAPVGMAKFEISSNRGYSGHEENPFFMLVRPDTTEFSGEARAMSFIYSGSFRAFAETTNDGRTKMFMGLNSTVFAWQLQPGEAFQSPECVLVYSSTGMNDLSHRLHTLYRTRLCRGEWRDKDRPVLINNWEATYFAFNEEKIVTIARAAADLGVELFVLDDGWFGKRDNDDCSLGDWITDPRKLPNGLNGLADKVNALGLRFGLWFEPEMVSPDSDLYHAHPDWCLHVDGRARTEARQQLVLDLARTEVQEYIISAVSAVLEGAAISYVKWDMNRCMSEAFSALPAARKKETQHRYMLGLYRVLETITTRFPHVLFESCASGGARFDPGMLYYMPQTWTSDDTDAVERIKIQYGTSLAYPPSAMGAHVSAVPNHQTGRVASMQMRGDVAVGGNFGFELDLSSLTPEDTETVRALIVRMKQLRTLTRTGRFTRLCDPFAGNNAAWEFSSDDLGELLICHYTCLSVPNPIAYRQRILCDASVVYEDDNGTRYSGAALAAAGLVIQPVQRDFVSTVIHLKKV